MQAVAFRAAAVGTTSGGTGATDLTAASPHAPGLARALLLFRTAMFSMKRLAATLFAAAVLPSLAQKPDATPLTPLPPDTPLVVDGNVRVEAADFEGGILRVPAERRTGFRISYDRVMAVVDNVYVTRSMAQKARDAGLDADPAVQARMRQVQDAFLAELYSQ